jgi:hypothetical protein
MKAKHLLYTACLMTTMASADTTLSYNSKGGQANSQMFLTDGLVKMTHQSEANTAVIFNAAEGSFTIVNHDQQSYMVFGPKELEALSDVSKMIDKMLEEQLAQMPAGQREQMRGMMKQMIQQQMPKQAPAPEYISSGQTETHNGYACEVVIKQVKGQSDDQFCVTDYDELGISVSEYAAIDSFMKTAEKLASQFGQDQSMNFSAIGQVVPVYYDMNGEQAILADVSNDALPAATFQVPDGYRKESLPEQMF